MGDGADSEGPAGLSDAPFEAGISGISATRLAAGFVLAAALVLVPAWVAPRLAGPAALELEREVLRWFQGWHDTSSVLDRVLLEASALGEGWTMAAISALLAVLLWRRDRTWALAPATAFLGTLALHYSGKLLVDRARPGFIDWSPDLASGSAYPSGHALETAAVWLVIVYAVSRHAPARARPWLWGALPPLVLLLGINRLYIGLHWPTDVLIGWVAGAAWGVACIAAFRAAGPAPGAASGRDADSARLRAVG